MRLSDFRLRAMLAVTYGLFGAIGTATLVMAWRLGFRTKWAGSSLEGRVGELRAPNRTMTNEKDRYLTDLRRADEAVLWSEQRFREISDNINDGLLIRDIKDARIVAVNRKLCEMYGYGPDEFALLETGALSVHGLTVGRQELERYQRRALEGEPVLFEWKVRRKDGTPLWVEINMKKASLGNEEYLLAVVRDITGRLEAQAALQESETKLQAIFDTVGAGIIIIDRTTQIIIEANQTAIEMTGLPKERFIDQICHSLVCPAQAGKCPVKDLGLSVDRSERKLLCADGKLKDILKTVHPITINGRDCYLESFIDISDRLRAEELLKEAEERFHQLFDNMADCVAIYQAIDDGSDFIFVDINRNGQLLSAISRSEAIGKRVTEIFPGVEKIGLLEVFRQVWRTGEAQQHPLSVYEDGQVRQWVENYVFKLPSGLIVALYSDTSEKHRAEEAMKLSEEKYRSLVEGSSDAIFTLDMKRIITSCNRAFIDLFGYEKEEVENRSVRLIHASDASFDLYGQKAYPAIQKQGTFRTEWDFARKDGTTVHVESVTSAIKGPDGALKGFAGIIRDITERKRSEEALLELQANLHAANIILAHEATHDQLTGILSRRAILDALSRELSRERRQRNGLAIGICDIDHFKKVNDTHGHPVGDEVLCGLVRLLESNLREYDFLGRFGGEEFVVIMPGIKENDLNMLFERLRDAVADNPIPTKAGNVSITVSIGATTWRGNETEDKLLAVADSALYQAKMEGRNRVCLADRRIVEGAVERHILIAEDDVTSRAGLEACKKKRS